MPVGAIAMTRRLLPPRPRLLVQRSPPDEGVPPEPPAERAEPARRSTADTRRGLRVDEIHLLIVDDDETFSEMLPKLLQKRVARPVLHITVARGPREAKEHLTAKRFDIVVCDYDLREAEDGVAVLAHAGDVEARPFRILMSGHARHELPELDETTMDAFVDKPMTLREVVPILVALLEERLGIEIEVRP